VAAGARDGQRLRVAGAGLGGGDLLVTLRHDVWRGFRARRRRRLAERREHARRDVARRLASRLVGREEAMNERDEHRRGESEPHEPSTDKDKPLYVISVAAELVDMHPQTLRLYERKGLIEPSRSAGKTRLYSQRNIEQLREIRRLTQELGVNLAGVEEIIRLRQKLDVLQERLEDRIGSCRSACNSSSRGRAPCLRRSNATTPSRSVDEDDPALRRGLDHLRRQDG
jgi:DNA-binding transcriptional MerR regulator